MQNSYITCILSGGLGNQLFQIFSVMAFSVENKIVFKFINSQSVDNGYRKTYWNSFLYKLKKCLIEFYPQHGIFYYEKNFTYEPIIVNQKTLSPIVLKGYFQSYKYFQKHYDKIFEFLNIVNWQNVIKTKINTIYKNNLNLENSASMHFRIGDYALEKCNGIHPILSIEFYINALKCLNVKKNNIDTILYFYEKSNQSEIESNVLTLKKMFPKYNFVDTTNVVTEDWEQLILMSLCNSNVIANSTFSWWGAYLNKNSQCVIYPSIWFGIKLNNSTKDLFPENWIKVNAFN